MAGTLTTTTTQTLQTTQSLQQQIGTQLQNQVTNQQYNLGNFVTNVSILPYLKPITIEFNAYGLKPNTILYAYFGNVPVSNYCAMKLSGWSSASIAQRALIGPLGSFNPTTRTMTSTLRSDSAGNCSGIFFMPANTFRSQEIVFRLTDVQSLEQGEDAISTEADAVFYGSTLSVAKGSSLLNVRDTVLSFSEVSQTQTVNGLRVATSVTETFVEDPPCRCPTGDGGGDGDGWVTPPGDPGPGFDGGSYGDGGADGGDGGGGGGGGGADGGDGGGGGGGGDGW